MEFNQSEIDRIIEHKKALVAPERDNRSSFECIMEWLGDATGSIRLSDQNAAIFKRWKEIYKQKLDGKTTRQIIDYISTFMDVSENTVRNDLKMIGKVFPPELDADVEMYVLFERNKMLINRLTNSNNAKNLQLLAKLNQLQVEIIKYFKENANLPDPNELKQHVYILTANPEDIGLEKIPPVDELLRMYKSKRNAHIEDAEMIPDEH